MLIYVCDDSKADQLRLIRNINSYSEELGASVSTQVFCSADEMLQSYKTAQQKPDIIFLDIYMNGTDGMSAAQELISLGMENGLIFTTSSEEHALQAFNIGADGYLHKPFTHEEFSRAMKRFRSVFEGSRRYIDVAFNRDTTRIYYSALHYAESAGHCTLFHTDMGELRCRAPLSSFIGELEKEPEFTACGRSFIINISNVKCFDNESGTLTFKNGETIDVPVRIRRSIKELLEREG